MSNHSPLREPLANSSWTPPRDRQEMSQRLGITIRQGSVAGSIKAPLFAVLLSLPLAAGADKLVIPATAPPAFQAECGACHLAFPPALLDAPGWRAVMGQLDQHYGDNASLDEPTRRAIQDFLVRHAGGDKVRAPATRSGEPPRLTATPWFNRKHHEVPAADWRDAKVNGPANCGACHTRATDGSYREREIVMPNGRPWEEEDDD